MLSNTFITKKLAAFQCRTFAASVKFPGPEPSGPTVAVQAPGPKNIAFKEQFAKHGCSLTTHFPIDLNKSLGNYAADTDGNMYLDVFNSIGIYALGYNHPALREVAKSDQMTNYVANRTALGINPPAEYADIFEDAYVQVAPKGLSRMSAMMCGTCSVEGAFKTAFKTFRHKQRGGHDAFTEEELSSCMKNQGPGSPDLGILSFNMGFHGRLFGALSATRTKAAHKVDMPAFDWPAADPPTYLYPLDDNVAYNEEQDRKSLAHVRELIEQWKVEKGMDIAAVIIEPIMSEGGDRHVSSHFANGLRKLTHDLDICFIVDEVQTGVGGTGTFWAHEQWDLYSPPDFVTFAKKMQSCGFYMRDEHKWTQPYRHFNTFSGDPIRALLTATQNKVIIEEKLVENTKNTGDYLRPMLHELTKKHPGKISQVRGRGCYLSFDVCDSAEKRDQLTVEAKSLGVNISICGTHSLRLRPNLYFGQEHANILVDTLDKGLSRL